MWPCQSFQENDSRDYEKQESDNLEETVPHICLLLRQQDRCPRSHLHLLLPCSPCNCFDPRSQNSPLGSSLRPNTYCPPHSTSLSKVIALDGFLDAF
nr:hypothetical protein Iba_chr11bCG14490 [Ipomoea batatas]